MYTFPMAATPQYSPGEVIANKYVVENLTGESPAARTFLANGNAGRLAIKIYRPEVSAKLLESPDFFLKAGVMTEIAHDNLASCIDVQEEMGLVFVARPFAEGESFEEWARKHRGQAGHLARGLEMLWQICQGLSALHERTRHLNIHPGNVIAGPVMARLCDPDPRALGNTEMTPDALPARPEYLGYRAPEMAGRGAGFLSYPSTDLFAIAGMLFRLAKGDHPSPNPAQTLNEARALDRDLALFLGKALHPKPEERFQEAGSFADALWELQGAMQRLQGRIEERPAAQGRTAAPARAPEPAPDPFAPSQDPFGQAKDPFAASASIPRPAAAGGATGDPGSDSFFDFFPSDPAAPKPSSGGSQSATGPGFPKAADPFAVEPSKAGGDTLFGAPALPSAQPAYRSPEPPRREPPPSRGGLSDLERPGTLFGSSAEAVPTPSKAPPKGRPAPPPPRPIAVSLSSLEKDPLEAAPSGEAGGFTTYGFKGAGDNRTGIYNPDGNAAAAKAKLRLLLGIAGIVVILAGLAAAFIVLRGNAAGTAKPAEVPSAEDFDQAPPRPAASASPSQGARPAEPQAASGQPYPDEASPEAPAAPGAAQARMPAPGPKAAGYSEPPMPVEPPRPGSAPETPTPAAAGQGNAHVSLDRESELMAMVRSRAWPASAAERLKDADELNDLGKTAEANLLYGKALAAEGVSEKQKVSALGGLAVTFQAMGMKAQAKDAIEKLLALNPKNPFALKMKAKVE